MCPPIRATKRTLLALALLSPLAHASLADDRVERFLIDHGMDQLLEVQLESRLERADSQPEREEIAGALSSLYLQQLRTLDRNTPYREVVLLRANALIERVPSVPLHELRLELLVDAFVSHEDAIELSELRLLDAGSRAESLGVMRDTRRGLNRLLAETKKELDLLERRRPGSRSLGAQTLLETRLDTLRRLTSFGHYYLGWAGLGEAVLEQRHVERETYEAFGWLLRAEGGMPLSKDLHLAALEYEHVARAVIGVALCESQSEEEGLAEIWLSGLLEYENLPSTVAPEARRRLLRVLVRDQRWAQALALGIEICSALGDGQLSVADARFVAMETLDTRAVGTSDDARELVALCVEQLVEQREIGHIVDLYQRYQNLPLIGSGFIPTYASALAELERAESESQTPLYSSVIVQLHRALKSFDADAYPEHRDDCRLKLAYALIRDDKPAEAIEMCELVMDTSVEPDANEEARWLRIAALDHANALAGKRASSVLEDAVRAYIERYPGSPRSRSLVLRYSAQGVIDPFVAIETLGSVPDTDPNALDAKRLLVQLQYELLRTSGFRDAEMLRRTRELCASIIESSSADVPESVRVALLQISIDLVIRDTPADPRRARVLIEDARSLIGSGPMRDRLEPELLTQLIRVALIEGRTDLALVHLDELRTEDRGRADEAQVLILNQLIELWETGPTPQTASSLVGVGVPIIARVVPPEPATLGVQQSSLLEVVAHAAMFLHAHAPDADMLALAVRLSDRVLEQGQPSEGGLRRTSELALMNQDAATALEAWLRLLAAFPQGDDRWYEARYESLVLMLQIDPDRARTTYEQFRTLNPELGGPPWDEKFRGLFGGQGVGVPAGGAP